MLSVPRLGHISRLCSMPLSCRYCACLPRRREAATVMGHITALLHHAYRGQSLCPGPLPSQMLQPRFLSCMLLQIPYNSDPKDLEIPANHQKLKEIVVDLFGNISDFCEEEEVMRDFILRIGGIGNRWR